MTQTVRSGLIKQTGNLGVEFMYETSYRGIRYSFRDDCLVLNDKVIDYTQISNIRHRGGADPAFIFEYSGRQFAMPYPPEELGAILPYMKKASLMKPEPAVPEPVAPETPVMPEPVAEPEAPEPVAEPAAEPVAEPTVEPVAEPAVEPVAEPAVPEAPVAEPAVAEAPVVVEPEPVAEPAAPKKSRKKLFIILGAIAAAIVIALVIFVGGGGEEEYVDGSMDDPGVSISEDKDQDITAPDVDPDATYDSVYDEYTARLKEEAPKLAAEYSTEAANLSTAEEKAQLSNDKISRLAEISNEGVEAMAEIMYANGDDYDVYEEWSMKLMNVYQEQAQLITNAYTDSAM